MMEIIGLFNELSNMIMQLDDHSGATTENADGGESNFANSSELLGVFIGNNLKNYTVGSRVISDGGDLCVGYLNDANDIIGVTHIMPDIVNVSVHNNTTVIIEFSDGTKEVARLDEGDVFSLETGILICITKKMLSDAIAVGSGHVAYNKIIKYALTKVDAKKKKRAEEEAKKAEEVKRLAVKKAAKARAKNKKREKRINELAEAIRRANMNTLES